MTGMKESQKNDRDKTAPGAMTRPAKRKRHERQLEVMRRYCRGESLPSIASSLGVAQQTVRNDLDEAREHWRERSRTTYDEELAMKLAELAELRREAWNSWHRSCEDPDAAPGHADPAADAALAVTTSKQPGDPRFLTELRRLLELEAKLRSLPSTKAAEENHQPPPRFIEVVVNTPEEVDRFMTLAEFEQHVQRAR